jgi:hypothetical protein
MIFVNGGLMKHKIFEKKYYGFGDLADIAKDVSRALFEERVSDNSDDTEGMITVTVMYEDDD